MQTAESRSFFNENSELLRLKKALKGNSTSWFGYIPTISQKSSINYSKIASLFARSSEWQKFFSESTPFDYFFYYIKKFIEADNSLPENAKICFKGLILKIDNAKTAELISQDIIKLTDGQKKLVLIGQEPTDQIYFLFTKKNNRLLLDIFGRGRSMEELVSSYEEEVLEHNKIICRISFKDISINGVIDKDWLQNFLTNSCFNYRINTRTIKNNLEDFPRKKLDTSLVLKKSDRCIKALLSTLIHIGKIRFQHQKAVHKRVYLRLELASLLDFHREHGKNLVMDSEDFKAMEALFLSLSEDIYFAHKKGYIDDRDLKETVDELYPIYDSLEQVRGKNFDLETQVGKSNMYGYTNSILADLNLKHSECRFEEDDFSFSTKNCFTPKSTLTQSVSPINSSITPILKIPSPQDKGELLKMIEMLTEHPSKTSIYEVILSLDLPGLENDPIWSKLNKKESVFLLEKFLELAHHIHKDRQNHSLFLIYDQELLLKISAFIFFLSSYCFYFKNPYLRVWNFSTSIYEMYSQKKRIGYRLFPENIQIFKSIEAYVESISDNIKVDYISDEEDNKNRKYINEIGDLIATTTHQYVEKTMRIRFFSSIYVPSRIQGWIRYIQDPFLLSAFFKVIIKIHGDTFDKRIAAGNFFGTHHLCNLPRNPEEANRRASHFEPKIVNMLNKKIEKAMRDDGVQTQEAIIDSSNKVFEFALNKLKNSIVNIQYSGIKEPSLIEKSPKFNEEEMTALLLVLRKDEPQTEIIAFLKQYPYLWQDPEVRNFLDALFFQCSLSKTLENRKIFREYLPISLRNLIEKYYEKALKNIQYVDQLVFIIGWNEKLHGIYLKCHYETDEFYLGSKTILRVLLDRVRDEPKLHSRIHMLLTAELELLLRQNQLSLQESFQVLKDYLYRESIARDHLNFDPMTERLIENKYIILVEQLENAPLFLNDFIPLLNLISENSTWTGTFPVFRNKHVEVDFKRGTVTDYNSEKKQGGSLPIKVTGDPLFASAFPDVEPSKIKIKMFKTDNKTKIYCFKDSNEIPCTVEEHNGIFRYYKKFNLSEEKVLQATSFDIIQRESGNSNLTNLVNVISSDPNVNNFSLSNLAKLPLIYDLSLYIDPKEPLKAYCFSKENVLLFKINFSDVYFYGLKIKSIIDCRNQDAELEVMRGSDVNNPIIQQLSCFEQPSQILVWMKNGKITTIELPRFSLRFTLKYNRFIPDNPVYDKYYLHPFATLEEKQGLPFSLLLLPKERNLPNKLIVPQSTSFVINANSQSESSWLVWLADKFISSSDSNIGEYKNISIEKKLSYFVVDIQSFTGEFGAIGGSKFVTTLEIAKQMLLLSKFEEAFFILEGLKVKKQDLTNTNKKFLGKFLSKNYNNTNGESAIKYKFIEILQKIVEDDPYHEVFAKGLDKLKNRLKPLYLEYGRKLPEIIKDFEPDFDIKQRTIESLESEINPEKALELKEMRKKFKYIEQLTPLILPSYEIQAFFYKRMQPKTNIDLPEISERKPLYERKAWDTFKTYLDDYLEKENKSFDWIAHSDTKNLEKMLEEVLNPKIKVLLKDKEHAKECVDRLINISKNPIEQIAIFSKKKRIATYPELMLALLHKNLDELYKKGKLPENIDLMALREALINYFDCEVRAYLGEVCRNKTQDLIDMQGWIDDEVWNTESANLYKLLTSSRRYLPEHNPELLIFEALKFITYRMAGKQSHQLEILLNILKNPRSVTVATTGSGKTTTISQLWALMGANGKNLLILKVLPSLYKQTLNLMQKDLEDIFKINIYPLRFDLKMCLVQKEKKFELDEKGERKIVTDTVSIFKNMYHQMLTTILSRGCIITDYKSIPLIEQKFLKLSLEFEAMASEGILISEIELEHFTYLRKILILIKNKGHEMMDELDQPNRPIHRIQLQIEKPKKPAPFLWQESLNIYCLLLHEEKLLLRENLHSEIDSGIRRQCLNNVAKIIAKNYLRFNLNKKKVYNYLIGKNENILNEIDHLTLEQKDVLAFYKDQFCTYLPLTLSYRGKSKYSLSDDGKRILPCFNGEKHEAKFGSIIEEINYSIQAILQEGVHIKEFEEWIKSLIQEKELGYESSEERFQSIFPHYTLNNIHEYNLSMLLNEVNKDIEKILYFLKIRLNLLCVSGSVISMDPQNCASMARTVSGVSATLGSADAFYKKFDTDINSAYKTRSEMVYRLFKRMGVHDELLVYDPNNPEMLLKEAQKIHPITALIDGAGAFITFSSEKIASILLETNKNLTQVGYYQTDGSLSECGAPHANIEEKGFYYSQPNTRGADIKLADNGWAIVTVNNEGTLESLNQQEGRMRHPDQKIILACSKYSPHLNSLQAVLQTKVGFESRIQADDINKAKNQELFNILRSEARALLLAQNDFNDYLACFKKFKELFITNPSSDYQVLGSYFERNKYIPKCDANPEEELLKKRALLIQKSESLGVDKSILKLNKIDYTKHLIEKMPETILRNHLNETNIEVELEEEKELETQQEFENEENVFELEQQKQIGSDVPYYLPRLKTNVIYQAREKINSKYDHRIFFTESFLPLSRKESLYKRKAFDSKMFKIGTVAVFLEFINTDEPNKNQYFPVIKQVVIGDLIDDTLKTSSHFIFDLRTRFPTQSLQIQGDLLWNSQMINEIINTSEFKDIIAQIRFFDGQIEGYDEEEINLLTQWIYNHNLNEMRIHFEKEILGNRPEILQKYPYSQIWKLFNFME